MNFGGILFARALGGVAVSVLVLTLLMIAVSRQQRLDLVAYERLGVEFSEGAPPRTEWWYWPPQVSLVGRFRGHRFRFRKVNRQGTHVMLECLPRIAGAASQIGRRLHRSTPFSYADLDRMFPAWTSLYASTSEIPWTKHFQDHRPLGMGSAPGIDLGSQALDPFDASNLRSDLAGLSTYCSESL